MRGLVVVAVVMVLAGCGGAAFGDGDRYEVKWSCVGDCQHAPPFTQIQTVEVYADGASYSLIYNDEVVVPAEILAGAPDPSGALTDCIRAPGLAELSLLFCVADAGIEGQVPLQSATWSARGTPE